jgi:hypothetical protein
MDQGYQPSGIGMMVSEPATQATQSTQDWRQAWPFGHSAHVFNTKSPAIWDVPFNSIDRRKQP